MKILIITALACLLFSLSGCVRETPEELKNLNHMNIEDARASFLKLPTKVQIELVSWELQNSKPSSSRYDFLLHKNGERIAKDLIQKSLETDDFNVYITMMRIYADMPVSQRIASGSALDEAISRCQFLGGAGNEECSSVREKLQNRGLKGGVGN